MFLLVLVVLAIIAGVGAVAFVVLGGDADDERPLTRDGTPGASVDAYLDAVFAGDPARACRQASKRVLSEIDTRGAPCSEVAKGVALLAQFGGAERVHVANVTVDGDRAEVTLEGGEPVAMIREGGAWRIDDASVFGATDSVKEAGAQASQKAAMDVVKGIAVPEAVEEKILTAFCDPPGMAHARRVASSTLAPDALLSSMGAQVEADGWKRQPADAGAVARFVNDRVTLRLFISDDDGGSLVTLDVRSEMDCSD